MEKKPKPAAKEAAITEPVNKAADDEALSTPATGDQPATGQEQTADTVVGVAEQAAGETAAGEESGSALEAPYHLPVPEAAQQEADESASGDDSAAVVATADDRRAPDHAEPAAEEVAAAAEAGIGEAAAMPDVAADQQPAVTAEPELVEVWRPGGRSDERRSQQRRPAQWQRSGHQSHGDGAAKSAGATADSTSTPAAEEGAETTAAAIAPQDKKGGQPRRPRSEFRRDREDGGERRSREHRAGSERPDRQGDRPPRGERPNLGKGRSDHKDRRDFAPHREREKQADPNSPFAKLAALKAQLEAAAKERR
jgi:ATP-dependent RNA helicase SUPV3L1/SUV3